MEHKSSPRLNTQNPLLPLSLPLGSPGNSLAVTPDLAASSVPAPPHWADCYIHSECSLHQLSPYIGKLKSIIARDLILSYTRPGDLVADMFCGSGTVPLEAARLGRCVFATDTSRYAITLTRGKLSAPQDVESALRAVDQVIAHARRLPLPDPGATPDWVRAFFHPWTLRDTIRLFRALAKRHDDFLLSALLGILHHQRPGFLSHPSSHLVPYLRSTQFPRGQFPALYDYRAIRPRLKAKVRRALMRRPRKSMAPLVRAIDVADAQTVALPTNIDCVITSPPYMNALDYVRDNRLRLWFLGEPVDSMPDRALSSAPAFAKLIRRVASKLNHNIRDGGHCIFVVGDKTFRRTRQFPSQVLREAFLAVCPSFSLVNVVSDTIPDVRRSRRNARGVTREHVLVFRKGPL